MLQGLAPLAHDARSWPFEQGRQLLHRVLRLRLDAADQQEAGRLFAAGVAAAAVDRFPALTASVVRLETGYGPSGLPHLGTFQEVLRTTMVRNAFRALTDDRLATELICFSDDMDGLRKAPPNLPHQDWLEEDMGKPLTAVRDPFGEHESFGAHNNARLRRFLDQFGFEYRFQSSTAAYRSGLFDDTLRLALERFDDIQAVMLPTLGPDRRATYSPFLPISPTTGRVLQVPTLERDVARGTIVFEDEDGTRTETSVTGGAVKLQWKPDWAMRWVALGVDYEMSGKDLIESVKVSNRICKVLGGTPPDGFTYELFLDAEGAKISKSKGNGLGMEEWLRYGPSESLAYYLFPSPKAAKRLHFDVIPKAVDDYLQSLDAYAAQDPAKQIDNPVWHVHQGAVPPLGSPVSFALLLNLVSASGASEKSILWGFIDRYSPGATPQTQPLLDRMTDGAMHYYEDFVRPNKRFRAPDARERSAFQDLAARLRTLPPSADAESIQFEVYEAGKAAGFEPLRSWFGALYEVLLGQPQGPRFGSFVAIFGMDRTLALIEDALAGRLTESLQRTPPSL